MADKDSMDELHREMASFFKKKNKVTDKEPMDVLRPHC